MTTASSAAAGSAGRWGALWGARPTDWALTEELQLPTYAPPDPDLSRPGVLEALAARAGLVPEDEFDVVWALEYPDAETLGRAMVAVAGLAVLAGAEREQELKTAIVRGLAPFRRADGSYRLANEYHYLLARA